MKDPRQIIKHHQTIWSIFQRNVSWRQAEYDQIHKVASFDLMNTSIIQGTKAKAQAAIATRTMTPEVMTQSHL